MSRSCKAHVQHNWEKLGTQGSSLKLSVKYGLEDTTSLLCRRARSCGGGFRSLLDTSTSKAIAQDPTQSEVHQANAICSLSSLEKLEQTSM